MNRRLISELIMKLSPVLAATLLLAVGFQESAMADPVDAAVRKAYTLETKNLNVMLQVGDDGRLYQRPLGAEADGKLKRPDEAYPQAGDGYVWEPALQVVHADGNTSTALICDSVVQTDESADIKLTRIQLHDAAYPFEVALCFRAHHDEDVIEQWAEIRHHESGDVILEHMASTSLLLATNVYLTHFIGDWRRRC
jgi:alpha-galactosidase